MRFVSRSLVSLLFGALALGGTLAGQTTGRTPAGLKVLISVDMEGITGITSSEQTFAQGKDYGLGRRLMVGDTNAAIRGAVKAGATEILVTDSHGSMINLDPSELIQDERIRLMTGRPRPIGMMQGIDASFNAVVFIGYHSRGGTNDSVLEHTWSNTITELKINGTSVGEYGINSVIAGHYGVPVVFIAGDQTVVDQARSFIPGIRSLAVKRSVGRTAANTMLPGPAQAAIEAGVREAITRHTELKPVVTVRPVKVEITFSAVAVADKVSGILNAERVSSRTIVFTARDPLDMMRTYQAITF